MAVIEDRIAEPRVPLGQPQRNEPEDAVRALFDAIVAGDDHSEYARGELATLLRLEYEVISAVESAARTFAVRRLEEVDNDGRQATLTIDVEMRLAWKNASSEWKPGTTRLRGVARLVNADGRWRVVDLPTSRGGSALEAHRPLGATFARDGDLELEAWVETRRSQDTYTLRLRNSGSRALTPARILDERRAFALLPLRLRLPFVKKQTLEPGDAWTFTFPWRHPFRLGRGSIGVEAVDDAGTVHTNVVEVPPPTRTIPLVFANLLPVRLFEAAAVALLIWGQLPGWILTTLLPGVAFLVAGVFRVTHLLAYARYRGPGFGPAVLGALAASELAAGTWFVLREDSSLQGVVLVATVTLTLLVPTLRRFRQQTSRPE